MRKKISIVIPTYNEEANVVPLSKAVIEVMERDLSEYDYEILFIDNHSKDNTQRSEEHTSELQSRSWYV